MRSSRRFLDGQGPVHLDRQVVEVAGDAPAGGFAGRADLEAADERGIDLEEQRDPVPATAREPRFELVPSIVRQREGGVDLQGTAGPCGSFGQLPDRALRLQLADGDLDGLVLERRVREVPQDATADRDQLLAGTLLQLTEQALVLALQGAGPATPELVDVRTGIAGELLPPLLGSVPRLVEQALPRSAAAIRSAMWCSRWSIAATMRS
jgi:hypothetical protein